MEVACKRHTAATLREGDINGAEQREQGPCLPQQHRCDVLEGSTTTQVSSVSPSSTLS